MAASTPAWAWDLLGMVLLSLLGVYLEFQAPFERHLVPETLWRYSYPHGPQSVPTWTLPFLGIFIPLAIILLVARTHGNALETRRAAAGLCLAVALGFAVTNFIKNGVGAFRPDFVARCWPDGEITWASHGVPDCRPTHPRDVMEGRKSFPSGHASMSFSGLSYASAYAAARLGVFSRRRARDPKSASAWRAAAAWAPLALAAAVSISRTQDYWHHLEDVAWGGIIGISCAGVAWAQKRPVSEASGEDEVRRRTTKTATTGSNRRGGDPRGGSGTDDAPSGDGEGDGEREVDDGEREVDDGDREIVEIAARRRRVGAGGCRTRRPGSAEALEAVR